MRPLWLEVMVEAEAWKLAISFGIAFSIQIRSRRVEADFWLAVRFR